MGHFALEVYGKLNATETSSEEKLTGVRKILVVGLRRRRWVILVENRGVYNNRQVWTSTTT
jgi:hypothetical protein